MDFTVDFNLVSAASNPIQANFSITNAGTDELGWTDSKVTIDISK